MREVHRWQADLGVTTLTTNVFTNNSNALRFYKRLEMVELSVDLNWTGRNHGARRMTERCERRSPRNGVAEQAHPAFETGRRCSARARNALSSGRTRGLVTRCLSPSLRSCRNVLWG